MNELLNINAESMTISARELHEKLNIGSNFTTWFNRMLEYGFDETDYQKCFPNLESGLNGGQNMVDYLISIDMAKHICMIQRTDEGKKCRQYLIDLEKAWNTPEQVMSRALKLADQTIARLKSSITEMQPKAIFADAVSSSHTSILVGDLAKLISQNGVDIGQQRLFKWLRKNGYLMKDGFSRNMPTQRSMNLGLMEVKESTIANPDGSMRITRTTKITGKGQIYFVNKFMGEGEEKCYTE